jgi:OOP family OmpA-OmpF porin
MDAIAWTDPNGCQHWVSDHGASAYMSPRLNRDGTPVCEGPAPVVAETITLKADALFDTNKADLRPEAIAELDDFGTKMNKLNKSRLLITGHTDSRGSLPYNQRLSEQRAASVAAYLSQNYGLQAETAGRGESNPVADNETAEGRQANRRVEIAILD